MKSVHKASAAQGTAPGAIAGRNQTAGTRRAATTPLSAGPQSPDPEVLPGMLLLTVRGGACRSRGHACARRAVKEEISVRG